MNEWLHSSDSGPSAERGHQPAHLCRCCPIGTRDEKYAGDLGGQPRRAGQRLGYRVVHRAGPFRHGLRGVASFGYFGVYRDSDQGEATDAYPAWFVGTIRAVPRVASARLGLLAATALLAGAVIGTIGLPWTSGWSGLSRVDHDITLPLTVLAERQLALAPMVVSQLIYLVCATATVGAAAARFAFARERWFRTLAFVVALGLPVLFKTWPLPPISNPINGLLLYHAVASGLPVWWSPAAAGFVVTILVGSARPRPFGRRSLAPSRVSRAWLTYAALVALGTFGLGLSAPPDESSLRYQLYGADPEGFTFQHWANAVVVWLGMAFVIVLRWTGLLHERIHALLVRHGSTWRLLVRELIRDGRTVLLAAAGVAGLIGAVDLVRGRPIRWTLGEVVHHLAVGPLVVLAVVVAAIAAAWLTGRIAAALVTLGAALAATLPSIPIFWPRPVTTMFQAARSAAPAVDWTPILSSAIVLALLAAALLIITRSRPLSFH
ncbi:MAG: hypothetical protein Q4F67_14100 [Propionibacteriaceae bacterium]|nr:hypothetical protein [Propionibacteriaceae bacterium]